MATTTSHLSLEEFHRLYDGAKPNHEYWYGEAIPKPMPTSLHGVLQCVLALFLSRLGWNVAAELTVKISQDLALVPDIVATRGKFDVPYQVRPVDLCVEILSPADRLKKAVEKGRRYLDWGVNCVWIINPVERTAWMLTPRSPEGIWIHPDGKLTAGDNTEISLPELFAELDAKITQP